MPVATAKPAAAPAIRPFTIEHPRRISRTCVPESRRRGGPRRRPLQINRSPVAVSVFPDDVIPAPRSWAERAYPRLIHYNQLDKGGHFAAWEQPKLLVDEMRVGLRSLR